MGTVPSRELSLPQQEVGSGGRRTRGAGREKRRLCDCYGGYKRAVSVWRLAGGTEKLVVVCFSLSGL